MSWAAAAAQRHDASARRREAAADAKIEDLTRRNAALQMQRQALLQSTSRRITSPLRACGRLFLGRPR
jgi:hypothetical protein